MRFAYLCVPACVWLAFCLAIAMVAAPSTAQATSFRDISFEELTARSTIVVEAEVVRSTFRPQAGRLPVVTDTALRVLRYVRGNGPKQIKVWQPGGIVGDVRVEVAGSPSLKPGQRYLLFLKPKPGYPADTFYLFALELGSYEVRQGPDGVPWAFRPSHRAHHGGGPTSVTPAPPTSFSSQRLPQAAPLWQLVARIRGVQ